MGSIGREEYLNLLVCSHPFKIAASVMQDEITFGVHKANMLADDLQVRARLA